MTGAFRVYSGKTNSPRARVHAGYMNELWVITEAKLWGDFMAPPRRRVVMHSMSPEKQKEARVAVAKMKEREFSREWEAYERWLQH